MRKINKKTEPQSFAEWKNKAKTKKWYAAQKPKGSALWDRLPGKQKNALRQSLLAEQGHICCYCGNRIENKPGQVVIEHLLPKSKPAYRHLIFEYENLLLSCNGCGKRAIYEVKQDDTLPEIIAQTRTGKAKLLQLNPHIDFRKLHPGERITYRTKVHCDQAKRNRLLPLTPLMPECETAFFYSNNGLVRPANPKNSAARQSIEILGLNNNRYMVRRRRETAQKATERLIQIRKIAGNDKEKIKSALHKLIAKLDPQPLPTNQKLSAFCFVEAGVLKALLSS